MLIIDYGPLALLPKPCTQFKTCKCSGIHSLLSWPCPLWKHPFRRAPSRSC
ncbi:hypothetical protein BDZ94DRAFT_1259249 [Collybia nuda]|uniref:Uncharacterized protein n=1 Tax=Collybia nuda TaxID=64659 RepID=A0A9P5Y725_9AGAR|nr:hypothetical protein BDZ94DRAFT_1259249 [Collybia nuda]